MSIPGRYRGLVVVVAVALLLGLADKAFSYRLATFATNVVSDLIAEVAELTAGQPPSRQTAIAPARPLWDGSRFQFPSSAENPGAYGAFAFGDQPWISLGAPLRIDLDATLANERPGPTSASSLNPGVGQRSTARRNMARNSGSGTGGASSGGVGSPAVAAGSAASSSADLAASSADLATSSADLATSSADLATSAAVGDVELDVETSALAERWSQLENSGTTGGRGGSTEGRSTDPNQIAAGDIGAFGDLAYSPDPPSDLTGPVFLSEVLALDEAIGGPGLGVQNVLGESAVTDVAGSDPSALGLEWLRLLSPEAGLDLDLRSPGGASLRIGESSSQEDAVIVLSEPALLAVFGIGLVALASRLRSNLRRARS